MPSRLSAPVERRSLRQIPTNAGTILVRPARRQRAWIVSHESGAFLGRFRTLDLALGAAQAWATDRAATPAPCDARSIAHT